jgi:hypothetical protein
VRVRAGDANPKLGFGFIIAQRGQRVFIVTAKHVVSVGDNPDSPPAIIKVSFYSDQGESFAADLLERDPNHDLALIRTTAPQGFGWEKKCLAHSQEQKRGTRVWFVGRDDRWYVPAQNGFISSQGLNPDQGLDADMPGLRPGSSGGPLVTDTGIIGIVRANNADDTRVLSIDAIKAAVQDWGYPWDLDYAPPASLAGGTTTEGSDSGGHQLPEPCRISVTSRPSGASVSLDGTASGETPTDVELTPGTTHELTVEKEKYAPLTKRVNCNSGHVDATLQKTVGDINIRYTGDYGACSLLLKISIGDKRFTPTSNLYQVRGVQLGDQDYMVEGRISCPTAGTCAASGSGSINVQDGATYDVSWANTAYARCSVGLQ